MTPSTEQTIELLKELIKMTSFNASAGVDASASNQLIQIANETSKINRIKGASNYAIAITYHGTGTENAIQVVHTGTTLIGAETIIETISYANPAINGSNVTGVVYS